MEHNTPKFRLRLNLFDGIVLVLALAVGALLLWMSLKPSAGEQGTAATASTVLPALARGNQRYHRGGRQNCGQHQKL